MSTDIRALLTPGYEPGDGSADGAQLVGGQWWHPVMGCDSLQIVVDNARANLTQPIGGGPLPTNYIDPAHQGEDLKLLQTFYQACQSEGGTADEICLRGIRAVMAACPSAPPAPEPGEVGKVVEMLLEQLSTPAPVPVAVTDRLPEPNIKVLAHYFNDLGKGRTICAIWVPAKSRTDSHRNDPDDFLEYDEEQDAFYWREGWYEAIENWENLGWIKVDEGEVVYWQSLPKWPAQVTHLPSNLGGEVEG
jgi:hypothetical protein